MLYQLLKSRYILFYFLIYLVCIVVNSGWWILQEVAFFDVTKTGELLSRLSEDTQIIKKAATTNLSEALRNVSTALIGLGFMFATSWKLTCKHLIIGLAAHEPHFFHEPMVLIMSVFLFIYFQCCLWLLYRLFLLLYVNLAASFVNFLTRLKLLLLLLLQLLRYIIANKI